MSNDNNKKPPSWKDKIKDKIKSKKQGKGNELYPSGNKFITGANAFVILKKGTGTIPVNPKDAANDNNPKEKR
jgi:hypothetical protein